MNLKKYCVIFVLVGTVITMMGVPARTLSISQSPFKNDSTDIGKENPESVVDEVLWVVGDEPILKSDLEIMRLQSETEGKNGRKILIAKSWNRLLYKNFSCIKQHWTVFLLQKQK